MHEDFNDEKIVKEIDWQIKNNLKIPESNIPGRVFVYFEKNRQFLEYEIKKDGVLLIQKEKPAIPSTQAGRYNEKNHYPLPESDIISQAEELLSSTPKVNNMMARSGLYWNGKLFLYFEKRGQYVEAEIKQGKINILPAVSELADFSVVPPTSNKISQAEELSSDFPKIEKMTARTGLYWNGIPYEYEMAKYSLNLNLDINWLNHFFDKTSSDINQFNAILSPQEAQERLNELLKTAESMDYTGDAVSHKSNIGKNRHRTFQFFAEQLRNGNIGYYDRGAVISTGQANWTTVNKSEIIDEPKYMFEKGWLLIVNDLDIEKAPEEVVTLYMRVSKSSSAYKNNLTKKSDIVNNTGIMYMKENNNTYGFVHNNKIYLNPDIMNSNAAVHDIKK